MLHRRFSPLTLLMISINGMVGSAWLFAPLYAAQIAGPNAIIAWLIGGAIAVMIALTFTELATMFPVAGGTAHIPQMSHGTFTSFILSWIAWLSAATMAPIEVQAILQYASTYFTSLMHETNHVATLTTLGFIWATTLMLLLCIINVASFKGLVRFNFILFLFKIFVIILTIFACIHARFDISNFTKLVPEVFSIHHWKTIFAAVASGGIAFAFTGFKHGVELAGETTSSATAIPLAVIGSIICCLILYLGLQITFIGALSQDTLLHGWQHVSFHGDLGPFVGLAASLGLLWLVKLLYIDAVISPAGAGLIYVTSTARILYAMSQIGYMPRWLSYLNKQNFPLTAIIANFALGMLLFIPLSGWQAMVSFLVSGTVIAYAMGPIALLCMRLELPKQPRPFRLPLANILCLCAFYCCNLLSYWTGWNTLSKLAIAILIGILFFIFAVLRGRLSTANLSLGMQSSFWMIPYLLGLTIISYLGAFGGKNLIPFGWDFVVIAIFSVAILFLAVKNRAMLAPKYPISQSSFPNQ